jgi:iron complex outermembrane receptor protein
MRDRVRLAAALVALALPAAASAQRVADLPPVEVVGITPLPGIGNPLSQVPSNVQTFGSREIARQQLPGIAAFLEQNAASVNAGSPSGNPFQPDLTFRGFTASPLLGTPQGLSVFVDGVRQNDPFGDVVHWDTIPTNAIASVQLVPGSNALYGLNTLGGALVMATKSGLSHPGYSAEINGGSFGRVQAEAEAGGVSGPWDGFMALNAFNDDGWREHSATRIRQLFARGGYNGAGVDGDITLNLADNTINGTQALPPPMLDDPKQAYT